MLSPEFTEDPGERRKVTFLDDNTGMCEMYKLHIFTEKEINRLVQDELSKVNINKNNLII
jgi:hypothetical protein